MFESCSLQRTASLEFHKDTLNYPELENTIACFLSCHSSHDTNSRKCLSFLYYSRKSVGDHARQLSKMEDYVNNPNVDQLTKLCLKSIMHLGGVFDYQGSLLEATASMNSTAKDIGSKKAHRYGEVKEITGLLCFKQGAALDKMGHYSIFLNVFSCLHYCGCLVILDDSISLCTYF
jgi:hypothetical protein